MIELEGVRSWLARLQTLTAMILEKQNALDDLSVRKHYALTRENKRLWAKLDQQYKVHAQFLQVLLDDLVRWTGCTNVNEVTLLLADVRSRMTHAFTAFEGWRGLLALIENVETLQEFTEESREDAKDKVKKQRNEYEVAVASVWRSVPMDMEFMLL